MRPAEFRSPNCRLRGCWRMSKNRALRVSYIAALAKLGFLLPNCCESRILGRSMLRHYKDYGGT
jgi:hypothetical protein